MSFTEWFTQQVNDKSLLVRMYTRQHDRLGESAASVLLYSRYSNSSPSVRDEVVEVCYIAAPLGAGEYWLEIRKLQPEKFEQHLANLVHSWPEAWCRERQVVCTTETAEGSSIVPIAHPSNLIHLGRMHGLILGEAKPYLPDDFGIKKAGHRLGGLLRAKTNDWHRTVG